MPQSSAPIVGVNLSDADWRDLGLGEAGVVSDLDGSAYKVTLPTDSDVALVGSTTQRSTAHVANFKHVIPVGETEPVTIPAASGSARTDILALRYDPAHTGVPGPVRLVRINGTSSGLPAYDDAAPGVEDLPLWSITRQPGQALSQATVRDLRSRLAPSLEIPVGAPLPLSSPLGTTVRQGSLQYVRELGGGGVPVWNRSAMSALLGVYDAPWQNPSGFWGTSPIDMTSFTVPDPGVPFRPQVYVQGEFGSTRVGTRWDFSVAVGGAANTIPTNPLWLKLNLGQHLESVQFHDGTGPMGPVLTGQQTYRLVSRRVFGDALAEVRSNARLFRVTYWAA